MHAHMAARNIKGASVLDPISQATHIRSEKLKKVNLPYMSRGNQISITVVIRQKAHSVGPEAHQALFESLDPPPP